MQPKIKKYLCFFNLSKNRPDTILPNEDPIALRGIKVEKAFNL